MPTTLEVPTLQELKVDEVNVSSAVLKAAAHHYGSQCDKPNKEFMLCRWEEKDPRKCIQEGRKVNECALNFFRFKNCMPAVICKTDPRSRAQRVIKDVAERWSQHSADFRSPYETGHKRQIKGNCAESFTEYWTCLDYTNLAELRHCRKQQQAFDSCVLDKLGWVRPDLGELSKVTKVSTSRPLPENPYHSRPRPEPNPTIEGKLEPAKHGSRLFFWTW